MKNVEINKTIKLSEHMTLGELTVTSVKTKDGNIPSHVAIIRTSMSSSSNTALTVSSGCISPSVPPVSITAAGSISCKGNLL